MQSVVEDSEELPDAYCISVDVTLLALQRVNTNKATGPDNIPAWVLKDHASILAAPLTAIFRYKIQQDTNQFIGNLVGWIVIYTIICLKSVCLSGDVRRLTLEIVAQSPREMSQTDRIHPRYFLLQIRVSIRRRFFLYA